MDDERTRADADRPTAGESSTDDTVSAPSDADDAYVDLDGDRPPRPPIEPESVDPEHAAFVVAGALLTVAVIAGLV